MWLRDLLPDDCRDARIMAFNHNTGWETNALSKSLRDHGSDLLQALQIVRQSPEVANASLQTLPLVSYMLHRNNVDPLSLSATALAV